MRIRNFPATLATVVMLSVVFIASAQERAIKKADLPQAVIEAFTKAYPQATVRGCSMEKEEGATVYEIESIEGSTTRDVSYAADGKLISLEETVAIGSMPQQVREGLERDFPGAVYRTIEKVQEHGAVVFEVLLTTHGQKIEVVYSGDGALMKKEVKGAAKKTGKKEAKEPH